MPFDPTKLPFSALINTGVLGSILVIALMTIYWLGKQHFVVYQAVVERLEKTISDNTKALNSEATASESRTRAMESSVQSQVLTTQTIERLHEDIRQLTQENRRLSDALLQKGLKL